MQTSKNYIQITKPNDDLSYTNSLSTNINVEGFNLRKIDDQLKISLNFYQTNQENEDNKTIPTVLPKIKYFSGYKKNMAALLIQHMSFIIFLEKVHARKTTTKIVTQIQSKKGFN